MYFELKNRGVLSCPANKLIYNADFKKQQQSLNDNILKRGRFDKVARTSRVTCCNERIVK